MALSAADAETFERCMAVGGLAVFGADTVYGLACDPDARDALGRIHLLKRRPVDKAAAIMFFDVELAMAALPELDDATRAACLALLPGPVTLLLPNPAHRFPLACGPDPGTLGLRVPALLEQTQALHSVRWPILQTSANLSGGPDPQTIDAVPERFRLAADLVLDAGALPGTASTVVDLRGYGQDGSWTVIREGALTTAQIAAMI